MDTHKVTNEYRLSQWAQVIQERQNSGQSIKEFCQRSGISRHAYFYWQKKLREAACTELEKAEERKGIVQGGWMQLASEPVQHSTDSLEIEINDCHITVSSKTNQELLKKICCTLRSLE